VRFRRRSRPSPSVRFTCCDFIISLVAFGIPIYAIVLFSVFRNSPCEQPLATWALVYGIYGIVSRVLIIQAKYLRIHHRNQAATGVDVCNGFLAILSIALYIAGSIYTFRIPWTNYYCPHTLVTSARVLFIFLYCVVFIIFALACIAIMTN
jgi:hypothetical protein